ncbi:hypothetical protein SSX86_008183 [Deinandra increscens subsp. villosa]|uniref:Small auxin up regulated protein n=1 Tax=Deinandra increscens subsp. villosa TaxID=3103831 RepID=A0AAP0DIL0_9ASTR
MHKIKGFRIRHRLVKLIKWRLHQKDSNYLRLNRPRITTPTAMMSKISGFARSLKKSAKDICFRKPRGYIRLGGGGGGELEEKINNPVVPKGHLAVYVGEKEDDAHRVLVPVIYINHPLFGDLLREAEKVYGYNYDGGIHVPCRISEFQNVQTKINAADGFRLRGSWRLA